MSTEIIETNAPAGDPATPKPRGLLPVPAEVEEVVAREKARLAPYMNDEAERRTRDDLTLQYYYEGTEIAYRITPSGVEVLAAGWDEVKEYLRKNSPEQRMGVLIGQP
jgi:hypothetical protein